MDFFFSIEKGFNMQWILEFYPNNVARESRMLILTAINCVLELWVVYQLDSLTLVSINVTSDFLIDKKKTFPAFKYVKIRYSLLAI